MKNVKIRIGNLKFGEAVYLGPKPEHPSFHIDVIEKNQDYFDFQKGYFVEDKERPGEYHYNGPDEERKKWAAQTYHNKACFENPETCWAVASFDYNEKEKAYDLNFFRWDSFLDDVYKEHREDFWRLLKAINESGIFEEQI